MALGLLGDCIFYLFAVSFSQVIAANGTFNTLRCEWNGWNFAVIFKYIFLRNSLQIFFNYDLIFVEICYWLAIDNKS